jgi:hypothetical protein
MMNRLARGARAAILILGCAVLGCATAGSGPPTTTLRIEGNVPEATIWIDDHLAGKAPDFAKPGKRLRVGFHRIEVRAPGYYSFFAEVDAKPGTALSLRADLHELLP